MTERYALCLSCKKDRWLNSLFNCLFEYSESGSVPCPECRTASPIRLKFPFGLEAGDEVFDVLEVFKPDNLSNWDSKQGKVYFCPFLVVV